MLKAIPKAVGSITLKGIITGIFIAVVGMTPPDFFAYWFSNPPSWLGNEWLRIAIIVVGLVIIGVSVHYNHLRQISWKKAMGIFFIVLGLAFLIVGVVLARDVSGSARPKAIIGNAAFSLIEPSHSYIKITPLWAKD